ncbi:hypothetical protein [Pelagibacterium luteolum]|uniref:Uncharacterized protein n=1 Tax=Pelagibacterium luteolum TaxID=440168 RepID=A0A1G7VG90_9HYPH|nr:hypothetical protein [Pelagibacterium luteolum]SDG58588.1 hypothetical protein SAMN04487974_104111 [Pelagibacterium luteolum]
MTVFSLIKTLFKKEPVQPRPNSERVNATPEASPQSPTEPGSPSLLPQDGGLAQLIDQQMPSSTSVMAGSFELVGLDEIKEALGSRWSGLTARASALAQEGIRRRISESDVLQVLSDTEFAICFSNLTKAAAVERAKQISREIKQEIIAELPEFSSSVTVKQYVAEIELNDLAGDTGSLADRLVMSLRRMRLEADRAVHNYRRLLLKDFQLLFAPLWDPERAIVNLNRCVLDLSLGCTTLSQFQAIADPDQMVDTLADMDCLALTRALEVLHRFGRAGNVAAILVPVGYQTLARSQTRREYLKLLSSVPEVYTPFVKLEVTNVPTRPNIEQLNNLLFTLCAVRPDLTLQVNGSGDYLAAVDSKLLWGLSCNLSMGQLRDPTQRAVSPPFMEFAKRNNLRTLAHGANTIGLALAAVDSGFTYVSGTAIHLSQDTPHPPSRLYPLTFPKRISG